MNRWFLFSSLLALVRSEIADLSMCSSCPYRYREKTPEMVETEDRLRLERFHQRLQQAFRSTGVPIVQTRPARTAESELPAHIIEQLDAFTSQYLHDDSGTATVREVYVLAEAYPNSSEPTRTKRDSDSSASQCTSETPCLNLSLPAAVDHFDLKTSTLWIYPVPYPRNRVVLRIEDPEDPSDYLEQSVSRAESEGSRGWVQLNLTGIVHKWASQPQSRRKRGIVRLTSSGGQLRLAHTPSKRPYLEVQVQDRLARTKRGPLNNPNFCPEITCCRKPLFFNWTQYNLSFIHQPVDGVDIGSCSGRCRVIQKKRHMIIANEAIKKDAIVYPCCTPTRFRDIDILYYSGNTPFKGTFNNMIVDKCGCEI